MLLPYRTTTALEREIRDRVQVPDKPFSSFTTALQTLMRRHGKLNPTQQLDKLYENMNPAYRLHIPRADVSRVSHLKSQMAEIEEIERAKVN